MNLEDSKFLPLPTKAAPPLNRVALVHSLGAQIAKYRSAQQLSIQHLSTFSSVPFPIIQSLEAGILQDIDIRTIASLCEALNTPIWQLFADAKLADEHYRWYH